MRTLLGIFFMIFSCLFAMGSCQSQNGSSANKEKKSIHLDQNIEQQLALGNPSANISIYIVTDWFCPACKKLEPTLAAMVPGLLEKSRVTFVDLPVHPQTQHFINYNLSLTINHKSEYLKLRHVLDQISDKTKNPTFEEVVKAMNAAGTKYRHADTDTLAKGNQYFEDVVQLYGIDRTPTVLIVNTKTLQTKKLVGLKAITKENVDKAIESLNPS